MTDEAQGSPAEVAAQVVAWHNRHPLARRITRRDVQGIGVVVLPFARDGQPAWDAPQPKRGLLALMFAPRPKRRQWPVFSEDLVPEIGAKALVRFAKRHALDDRPGPADLPERVALTDPALLHGPGGKPPALPPERLQRYLLSAAIDVGARPSRVMLGAGRRPAVLGQRQWSLPRLAALGAGALVLMVGAVAGLWLKAMAPKPAVGPAGGPPKAASAAASGGAAPGASAAAPKVAPPPPAAAPSPAPVAQITASAPAPTPAAAPAVAASAVLPAGPVPAAPPVPASGPTPPAAPAASVAAGPAGTGAGTPPAASGPTAGITLPPPAAVPQRASAPLVPRLKPDLAAQAQAEAAGRTLRAPGAPAAASGPPVAAPTAQPMPPAMPGPAAASPVRPPVPAKAASAARFYALVSKPMRSKADAEALLRRVRAESERINHPTANQTSLLETREGWRVSWWPFTHQRQADNARAALARRFELEVVEF